MTNANLLHSRGILLPIFSIFLITFLLVSSQAVYAETIFEDTFDKDPQANGWTEKMVQVQGNSEYPSTAVGEISPTGERGVVLKKTGGASGLELSITKTIDTTGFEDIELDLRTSKSSGFYESEDFLHIEYNVGSGFETLYKGFGNSMLDSTKNLSFSSDANENSSLMIRLTVFIDEADEAVFLDNLRLQGHDVKDDDEKEEEKEKEPEEEKVKGTVDEITDALKANVLDFVEKNKDANKLTKKLDKVIKALNPIDETPKHIAKLLKDTNNLLVKEKIRTDEYNALVTAIQTGDGEKINAVLAGIILSDKDLKKLTNTIAKLNPDLSPDIVKACKELDGFNKEVNKLFDKGKLTVTNKDALIVKAEAIKTSLECV